MLATIDWIIIILYFALVVYIGFRFKKRSEKSLADFFVGGRKLTWWLAGLSMVATTFAADTPLAVTEIVRKNGISGNWLWWNFLIGGMLTTFFFAKLWRRSEVLTEVELIKIRYSGKEATFLRGLKAVHLGFFMNSLIIAWVNLAMISILKVFLNITENQAFIILIIVFSVALIYSALSGIWGVAITDAIQFFIAITGTIILAVLVINSDKIGGIEGLKAKLPAGTLNFLPKIGKNNAATTFSLGIGAFLAYSLFQWWASWYPGAEPGGGGYIAQRMLSTKNEKHSFFATLFFQIMHYIVRPFPWILVGLATFILYPDIQNLRDGYVYAMRDFLPIGLKGLLVVAFLAAYMSTISTQLNFGSSILTNDLYLLFKNQLTEKQKVIIGRIFTVILMLISLGFTLIFNSISGVWKFVLECGAGLGFVLILRWYWWRLNAWSEIAATLLPFFFYGLAKLTGLEFPVSYFFTVGLTVAFTLIITYLTKPTDKEILQNFYNKIQPQGWWKPVSGRKNGLNFYLIIAWLSSVIFLYAVLFLTGKIILHFWTEALISLTVAIVFFVIMLFSAKKSQIF